MWRWTLLFAAVISLPASAGSLSVLSLMPDGNGGAIAFALASKKVVAIPIDASGTPHPERAADVWRDAPADYQIFGIARTPAGYLMSFSDALQIGWVWPLRDDF